jgi:CSLREA domain-containing protein
MAKFFRWASWPFWQRRSTTKSHKKTRRQRRVRLFLEPLEARWLPSVITVNTTGDDADGNTSSIAALIASPGADGTISLREAIMAANNTPGPNTINFSIGSGVQTINVGFSLPTIVNNALTIDGTTQPGFNTTTDQPLIVLNGGGFSNNGLDINVANCTTKGLVIQNFKGSGILLETAATGTTVADNYIGTDSSGMTREGNSDGITVQSSSNTIGGTGGNATRNVISSNSDSGGYEIRINGAGNVVEGNYIGTTADGTAALGANAIVGVEVFASNATIGGTASGAGNVISGFDTSSGVGIEIQANGALVEGNYIGTNAAGTVALPNGDGVLVELGNNDTIGGTGGVGTIGGTGGPGNVISGNVNGIHIEQGIGDLVQGNYVGTNAAGTTALPNREDGVLLDSNSSVTIGGTTSGAGNVISGNGTANNATYGIDIMMGSTAVVQGNYIGINAAGTAALGNASDGVHIVGNLSTIGGIGGVGIIGGAGGPGNVISGNGGNGIFTSGNVVQGNYIGTDFSGTVALGNKQDGVLTGGGVIGGTGAGNVISGNGANGVEISGGRAALLGNLIGTNAAGTAALANMGAGVLDTAGALIGDTTPGDGNLISGNGTYGIDVEGSQTFVKSNKIGTNINGTAAVANTLDGVFVGSNGGTQSIIGGVGAGNLISGNGRNGINITGFPLLMEGNDIGTNAVGTGAVANMSNGVLIASDAFNATIGGTAPGAGNLISGNGGNGISILESGARVQGNRIGTDVSGTTKLANAADGVSVGSGGIVATIGGTANGAGNVISGNGTNGIEINATAALVEGNKIGTDVNGTTKLANTNDGVLIDSGGTSANIGQGTAGNVISGNGANGIEINATGANVSINDIGTDASGAIALGNTGDGVLVNNGGTNAAIGSDVVSGNSNGIEINATGALVHFSFIGTNATGTAGPGLGNASDGVLIDSGGAQTTIGGTAFGEGNVISGNGNNGIEIAAQAVLVDGNKIGTDANGAKLGNINDGVLVDSGGNSAVIGGTDVGFRNIISGNLRGVELHAPGAIVQGNYIGTDSTGMFPLGNSNVGVFVGSGGVMSHIGGMVTGAGNVIAESLNGIVISDASAVVQGNYIGTNAAGTASLGNANDGVLITGNGGGAVVGGTTPPPFPGASGAGNLVSGNGGNGIEITAVGALVQGNYVGTDVSGMFNLRNSLDGVLVGSGGANTVIGGTPPGAGNVISGNSSNGAEINVNGTVVLGNLIGVNAAGNAALGNTADGVLVDGGGTNFMIGGAAAGAGNVISANGAAGIAINATGGVVQQNLIGTNAAGTAALGNGSDGVQILAGGATVGGTAGAATRNIISGNTGNGVFVYAVSGNAVEGNYIGTDITGATAIGNGADGVLLEFATGNTIGGTISTARNIISGNLKNGVEVDLVSGPVGNLVDGNYIGTDVTGAAKVGNSGNGVLLSTAANNTIGGTISGARNFISGNTGQGILIIGSGSTGNQVLGNYIGTNAAGNGTLGNSGSGVDISNAPNNSVGSKIGSPPNVISGNGQQGILISGLQASGNLVYGDYIGTDATASFKLGNSTNGVYINNAPGTSVGVNVISGNGQNGILIAGASAVSNSVFGNFIGTDLTGTVKLGNTLQGVSISSASFNNIGQITAGGQNVISGNGANGVQIAGGGAHDNTVVDDLIGTDITGSLALGNTMNGVFISNSHNNIVSGDVVSANGASGVLIDSSFASGNRVDSSFIGTDATGSTALGNALYGVFLSNAPSNTLGGPAGANVISGNRAAGVVIAGSSASANLVEGNLIGTDLTGSVRVANIGDGVLLEAPSNTLQGNTISGNQVNGVEIFGTFATGNHVQGNHIGTDVSGTIGLGNTLNGVEIESSGNAIGGASGGNGNLISGNLQSGVYLLGTYATGNTVAGNYIGTDATGTTAIANLGDGVFVTGNNNTIGGSAAVSGNLISGNRGNGIEITSSSNLVLNNHIGTDVHGSAALPNGINGVSVSGVLVSGANNSIGAFLSGNTLVTAGNLISGNANFGVLITGSAASGNLIAANRIGTDVTGTKPLANSEGVVLLGASNNTVGGALAGAGNVISGNVLYGLEVTSGAAQNTIQGNLIGTNAGGNASLGNGNTGVFINGSSNTIGGTIAGAGNTISGNSGSGIFIGASATATAIQGNFIGTDNTGKIFLANGLAGIEVAGQNITIGGTTTAAANVISGNKAAGISFDATAAGTLVQGNDIGTQAGGTLPLGNGTFGVIAAGNNNTIGGALSGAANVIAFNPQGGIDVLAGSGNTLAHNSIFANGSSQHGPGIVLTPGANNNQPAPVLKTATYNTTNQTLTVTGTLTAKASTAFTLEFFCNPTGDPEGRIFLGSQTVTTNSAGTVNFTFTLKTTLVNSNPLITATATDPNGNTSAFSAGIIDPPASPRKIMQHRVYGEFGIKWY